MLTIDLRGKNALVTASTRGIGRAIALRLAEAGANVVINSRASADDGLQLLEEIRRLGVGGYYLTADVSRHEDVQGALREVALLFEGRLDILVNNADWFHPLLFEENNEAYWDQNINGGMKSAIFVTHAALPLMKHVGHGKIVNIGGDSGRVGLTGGVVHSGVKGALVSMTKSWAREFAQYGIRVNAISPGPIATELLTRTLRASLAGPTSLKDEVRSLFGEGQPDDIAYAVIYLVSSWGNFVTGQTFSVNGGRAFPS